MWQKVCNVLFWLGVSVYFGGIIVIGTVVAPAVFDAARDAHLSMPGVVSPPLELDRQAGGEIFGVILYRFAYVEAGALAVLFVALAGGLLKERVVQRATWIMLGLWVVVAGLTAYDAASLRPRVWSTRESLRQTAAGHAHDAAGASWPEREAFDALHTRSETLAKIKAYALLAMILLGAWQGAAAGQRNGEKK